MRRVLALVVAVFASFGAGTVEAQSCPTPDIDVSAAAACPYMTETATVQPPAEGSWTETYWNIEGGKFRLHDSPYEPPTTNTPTVSFYADGTGPVTLRLTARHSSGCFADEVVTAVPLRDIGVPVIDLSDSEYCPMYTVEASVQPPADGTWQSLYWQIEGGKFRLYDYPYESTETSTTSVSFYGDGEGPVTLRLAARDSFGCDAPQATATVPRRTIAAPVISASVSELCPMYQATAYVQPPSEGEWQGFYWTIEGGWFDGDQYPYSATEAYTPEVRFYSNDSGPVTLKVMARDPSGCETPQASLTIPLRTIAAPVINVSDSELCPMAYATASAQPPADGEWQNFYWTIEGGSFSGDEYPYSTSEAYTPVVRFHSNDSGPVTLRLRARDALACESPEGSVTIPLRAIAAPVIELSASETCAMSYVTASAAPPAQGDWQSFFWTIEGGRFTDTYPYDDRSAYTPTVQFHSDGTGPITLRLQARDSRMCESPTATATVALRTVEPPVINVSAEDLCNNDRATATVQPPATGSWQETYWTIEGGEFQFERYPYNGTYASTPEVTFRSYGLGPVRLMVDVRDSAGCHATASKEVPLRAIQPPVIELAGGACPSSATITNSGAFAYFWWTYDNVQVSGPLNEPTLTFTPVINGPVTLTVTAYDENGCSTTSTTRFDASGLPDARVTVDWPLCVGKTATASVPDAGEGATYSWSANSTASIVSSPTSRTVEFIPRTDSADLTVVVTPATGCKASSTIYASVGRPPVGGFDSIPSSMCSNTTAVVKTYPGWPGTTYAWSVVDGEIVSGQGTSSITVRSGNASTMQVRLTKTDPNTCSVTLEQNIAVHVVPEPVVTPSGPTTFCEGGSVSLTAPAGYTYLWSTGEKVQTIVVSRSGSYSVQVMNASGCSATSAPTVVTVGSQPSTPTLAASCPTTFCEGGSVTLSAPEGFSYLWSNGATTRSIEAVASGSYSVTVTDANGCSATSSATTVTVNAPPATPVITASGPITFCEGGSVSLSAPAGFTYAWSNGATTQSINVGNSGSYSVTVTDANGCSATSSATTVTVNAPPATPVITASGPITFCEGGSVSLSAPVGFTYVWSNGATTQSINVTTSGSYSVTVTDANGCSATLSATTVTVNAPPATPVITSSGPTTFCEGGSVSLSAPAGFTYAWSNGASTQSINVTTSGSYSVTVTDANGCSATSSATTVTVNAPPPTPVITSSGPTTFCGGGSVSLTAPAGFSYLWSNGANTQSIDVTQNGTYSVVVTNGSGCSAVSEASTVTVHEPISVAWLNIETVCSGVEQTAQARAARNGAYEDGVTYDWTISGGTITRFDGDRVTFVSNGSEVTLTATATDANGCTAVKSRIEKVRETPAPAITAAGPTAVCEGTSVTLVATEGYGHYVWSNGQEGRSISVSQPGEYRVTVVGDGGCTATSEPVLVTVNAPPATPTITASGSTTFCAGGSVTLSAPDGFAYAWSNGATTQSIDVATSGDYSVTTTDANGCSATSEATTVTANAPPATPVITASGPTTFCAGGSVTLSAPAGFAYAWSNGATMQLINVTTSGSYSVTTTDANGCSATSEATTVTANAPPATPVITASGPTTFCAGGSVTLSAPAGFAYAWSNGATTQSINVTTSGSYSVTTTDANGCGATSAATTVTANAPPATPVITASGPTTFCAGGSVTLSAPAGFAYVWSNGATTQAINVTSSGSYSVTTTDANGCSSTSASTAVVVNANPVTPTVTASGPTTFCAGGSVTLSAPAGLAYAWSNGATTQSINVTASGSYSVVVTNASGCSASSAATSVTVRAATSITQQPKSVTIPRNTVTTLSVTATGTGTLTYQWYRGSSGNTSTPISGATGSSYTTPKLSRGAYTYWVRVSGTCGTANSVTATVTAQ